MRPSGGHHGRRREGERGPRTRVACCALLGLLLACSGAGDPAEDPAAGTDAATPDGKDPGDVGSGCPAVATRPDGQCCPAGTYYAFSDDACLAVGPLECAQTLPQDPAGCHPRWCADWRDSKNADCDVQSWGCLPIGRPCTAGELAQGQGCPAGQWPSPEHGQKCTPAGTGRGLSGQAAAGSDTFGLPEVASLPPLSTPRWCWKLTDSDGVGCAASEPQCGLTPRECGPQEALAKAGCEAGQWPGRVGQLACRPVGVDWVCPPGFVTGTARPDGTPQCAPDPGDCGAAPYPAVAAGPVVYVASSGGSDAGNGTMAQPFATLAKAVAVAPDGATIAVGAGTYQGSFVLGRPLAVVGRCAALVRVVGHASAGTIVVTGKSWPTPARLAGLHIEGVGPGIGVQGGLRLQASRLWIDRAQGVGLAVLGPGSRASLAQSVISETGHVPSIGLSGVGLLAEDNAELQTHEVAVLRPDRSGLVAIAGAQVRASDLRVEAPAFGGSTGPGVVGLAAATGAGVDLFGASLTGVRAGAVQVGGAGTRIRIGGLSVGGCVQGGGGGDASGALAATTGGALVLSGAAIEASAGTGLVALHGGTKLLGGGVLVAHMQAAGKALPGMGGMVAAGGQLTLLGSRLHDAATHGLIVGTSGTRAILTDTLIDETGDDALEAGSGQGLVVDLGAYAQLTRVRLHRNRQAGLLATREGTVVDARSLLVDGTMGTKVVTVTPTGVRVSKGASLRLRGGRLSDNQFLGMDAAEAGHILAAGLLSDHGRPLMLRYAGPTPDKDVYTQVSIGVRSVTGASLALHGARVTRMLTIGMSASGESASLQATGVLLDRTAAEAGAHNYGLGLLADSGADTRLFRSEVVANHMAGIVVAAARLTLDATVVRDTRAAEFRRSPAPDGTPAPPVMLADGVLSFEAGEVTLDKSVITGQLRAGVLLLEKSTGKVTATVLAGNGYGVVAQSGASFQVPGSALWDNPMGNAVGQGQLFVPPAPFGVSSP